MSNAITATSGQTDESISNIDGAVEAARQKAAARKAAKGGTPDAATTSAEAEKAKRRIYTPEERLERAKKIEEERAARKEKRQQESAAKREQVQATRGTPHMSKVEKAAAGLAPMDEETQAIFNEAKGSLSGAQIDILLAHLAFHSRRTATEGSVAVATTLKVGQPVRITSGPAKLIGKEGTLAKVQKIHCYVDIPGYNKPAYLFNRNVELIEPPVAEAAPESEPEVATTDEEAPVEQTEQVETAAA